MTGTDDADPAHHNHHQGTAWIYGGGARGARRGTRPPAVLRNYGRLRSVTRAPNGDLLITTGNGTNDAVLRVHPRG